MSNKQAEHYPGFEGRIERLISESTPWWPPRQVAPKGAPNVVVVLCDDLGFSDLGCYGSEIQTPNLDRLAENGVRYTNFHSMPLCSPTRASLLTGVNAHRAGLASVGPDIGFPAQAGSLSDTVVTAAEALRANGYATFMVGKWHLNNAADLMDGGSKASWPLQRGFDQYYGFSDPMGFTNLHQPHWLQQDNSVVEVDEYPDDYYFTDDITDRAISMIRSSKSSNPAKPFFLYLAHGAVHGPLMAKSEDMAKYRGRYDAGWNAIREERYQRQLKNGVIDEETRLAPDNSEEWYDVQPWESFDERTQEYFARHMEVYAGMVDNIDQNFGRLVAALEDLGELDNTIILFTSDNGASREGGEMGTTEYMRTVGAVFMNAIKTEVSESDLARIDDLGGPRVLSHYPWGWAMASNTPFRLYKSTTFAGGHQVPMIISWPERIAGAGEIRRQYTHVTDVLPTILDLVGAEAPKTRDGKPVEDFNGVSISDTIWDPNATSPHPEQYYELEGHRGYYRDGWEVLTLHYRGAEYGDHEWQLFNIKDDPTQIDNLADRYPERVAELAAAWEQAAWENRVFPLGDGGRPAIRPGSDTLVPDYPVTIRRDQHTLDPYRSKALIRARSFVITIPVTMADGDEGILVSHGDQGGGYNVYVQDGRVVFSHNAYGHMTVVEGGALSAGEHVVEVRVNLDGPSMWQVDLVVDGDVTASSEPMPALDIMAPFEGINVGIDRRSPVNWDLYEQHGSFRFTGQLERVVYAPGGGELANALRVREEAAEAARKYE